MRYALLVVLLLVGCQSGGPRVAGSLANDNLVASLTQTFWAERERVVAAGIDPPIEADQVTDLACDGTVLSWSYVNMGDYDQNGEVGIADLTMIALHFEHKANPDWPDLLDEVVDGDQSGEVGVSDITPLALNYLATVARYSIQGSSEPDGTFGELASVNSSAGTGLGRLQFDFSVPTTDLVFFRVVPVDANGELGTPSNVVGGPNAKPVITTVYVDPTGTYTGWPNTFSADVVGTEPLFYEWGFAGATNPITSTETSPTVTITAGAGIYSATLIVSNEYGADEFNFPIDVRMPIPARIVEVFPTEGYAGTPVTFQAEVAGDPTPTYAWDFGGAAIPATSAEVMPTVTLGTPGNFTIFLRVRNLTGEAGKNVPFRVLAPPTPPTISGVVVPDCFVGTASVFSAEVSGDEPLTYAWDFGGGAEPDTSSEVSPTVATETAGDFVGRLTVNNTAGQDDYDFNFTVRDGLWAATSLGAVGRGTAPMLVNGYPAVAYDDMGADDIKFVRAADAFGASWGAPVSVTPAGTGSCLAIIDGHPAVMFWHNDALRYVRANDVDGMSWPASDIIVDDGRSVGPSLTTVNGNPAVAYVRYNADFTDTAVRYARADDPDGSSWGAPLELDNNLGFAGGYPVLAVVENFPAVAYTDDTAELLKFIRATDTSGTSWDGPTIIDNNVGYTPSLAVVDGLPAVSYVRYDGIRALLYYIRAANATGGIWPTPIQVATQADWHAGPPTLAVIANRPAIAYGLSTVAGPPYQYDLRYIRSDDISGNGWSQSPVQLWPTGGFQPGLAEINGRPMVTFSIPSGMGVEPLFVTHLE